MTPPPLADGKGRWPTWSMDKERMERRKEKKSKQNKSGTKKNCPQQGSEVCPKPPQPRSLEASLAASWERQVTKVC